MASIGVSLLGFGSSTAFCSFMDFQSASLAMGMSISVGNRVGVGLMSSLVTVTAGFGSPTGGSGSGCCLERRGGFSMGSVFWM